jgi:hypothetical protein
MTGGQGPRDVESRLRASLHAYAEVVDDEPPRRSPVARARGGSPGSPVRGWRAPLLVAAAVIAVAGGAWLVVDQGNAPSPTAASGGGTAVLDGDSRAESAPEQSTDSSAEAQAGAAADATVPEEELGLPGPVEVGVAHPFDLYTHCGILGADVGGRWFAADAPLVEEFGPPAGWDDPYQRGMLTLESEDRAVFRDDAGHELRLRAAPESERPPPCA